MPFNQLDTGLTEGQPVLSLSKGRCDDLFGASLIITATAPFNRRVEFLDIFLGLF